MDGLNPVGGQRVASATATGGSGVFYEQHVGAFALSLLLVQAVPPVLTDCVLTKVTFQAERLGWRTDDLLLTGSRPDGVCRQLAAQVKRDFTVSRSDEDCRKAFTDFWTDFENANVFHVETDRLALVVLQGTRVLLGGLGALLDCARVSRSSDEFAGRLTTPGGMRVGVAKYAEVIRGIVQDASPAAVDDVRFWRFLCAIHLLNLDLNTATRQTEAAALTLLAHAAAGGEGLGAAETTWKELLALVAEAMPQSADYRHEDLPAAMRARHSTVRSRSDAALAKLREHTAVTRRAVRTSLGAGVSLARSDVVTRLLAVLGRARVVLVTGPAGAGKSAVVKQATESLDDGCLAISFRAEEFAVPHLDDALRSARLPCNAEELRDLLAGQSRKILTIESVERLLESADRHAFFDLLRIAAAEESWQVVLTCRDYSAEVVRSSLLDQVPLPAEVFEVPSLADDELNEAVRRVPRLAGPASHPPLRELFRNPYILDKAARMSWPAGESLPADERAFRQKFWRDVVRQDDRAAHDLPSRRQSAFATLCLRRARALVPFARCDDLDREALRLLRHDALVELDERAEALAAPAHDVLEDWAILVWIDEQFALCQGDRRAFARQLGSFPAIRRAYRKWLGELLQFQSRQADGFVLGVVADGGIEAHFKDDTLIAALLSRSAPEFLDRSAAILTANGADLLRRGIHLLRVACKAPPPWLSHKVPPIFLVPAGTAWPAVLKMVNAHLAALVPAQAGLLVGLISDWSYSVAGWAPHPPGTEDAADIAHKLLPSLGRHDGKDLLVATLGVIAKVPKGNDVAFLSLVERAKRNDRGDHVASEFAAVILPGMECAAACRDLPDAIADLAKACLLLPAARTRHRQRHLDTDQYFGMVDHFRYDFLPPSALRGPFAPLLQHHPAVGISLVLDLCNHAGDSYARQDYLEPFSEVRLTLPDGVVRTQWCNGRFWAAYRGLSVAPYPLQCALMALEAWLLKLAGEHPEVLDDWLVHLLSRTNNVAVTAVVASVATAHPRLAPKSALALLSSRDLILIDKGRLVHDMSGAGVSFKMPLADAYQKLYEGEREESAKLPHRRHDLELAALQLQFGPERERVQQLLDDHLAALPPAPEQSEGHKIWRLALHRMDARRYRVTAIDTPAELQVDGGPPPPQRQPMLLAQTEVDPDVAPLVRDRAKEYEGVDHGAAVYMWALKAFRREEAAVDAWRERLSEAQTGPASPPSRSRGGSFAVDAPSYVAAVCARDHWDEMSAVEQRWCMDQLVGAVRRHADSDDIALVHSGSDLQPAGPAAYALAAVLAHGVDEGRRAEVEDALVVALTHPVANVVAYAAEGVGSLLAAKNPNLVFRYLRILVARARRDQEVHDLRNRHGPFDHREPEEIPEDGRRYARSLPRSDAPLTTDDLPSLAPDNWVGKAVIGDALRMVGHSPNALVARDLFARLARAIPAWGRHDHDGGTGRNHHLEHELLRRLARFAIMLAPEAAVELCAPLLDMVASAPDEVAQFVTNLTGAADASDTPGAFWPVWHAFGRRVVAAAWVKDIGARYRAGDGGLVDAMFLSLHWKDGVLHWRHLDGHADGIDRLFTALPPAAPVFRAYARFLYKIGDHSLPGAFRVLADRLAAADVSTVLSDSTTVYCLESVLRRFVYGKPEVIKADADMRQSVLHLLDALVEAGSSSAYRMRDDFVTPLNVV